MPRRGGRAVRLGALMTTAIGLVLGGCTAGPSASPPILVNDGPDASAAQPSPGAAPVPLPPLETPNSSGVNWIPCVQAITDRLAEPPLPADLAIQCGRVNAVLDSPATPGRGYARLALLKAGTGPVPLVVLNDVDGQPGTVYAARLAAALPKAFLDRFSLIGLDRRGTGASDPVRCVPTETRDAIIGTDPAGLQVEDLLDQARIAGQQCSIELENRLPAYDTWRTAADLDAVRDALGVGKLNAVGHGEGSRVLSVFADRYPDKVGRVVLDGVPDPSEDSLIALDGVAGGAEATFDAFAQDCAARACELGADPKATFTGLLQKLRGSPLYADNAVRVDAGSALRAVLAGLEDRSGWPALATAIAQAGNGDGNGLAALLEPIAVETRENAARFDVQLVTGCNDTKPRLDPERIKATAKDWQTRYPLFGAFTAQRLVLCSPWTVATNPVTAPAAKGSPPILVLGTASDPRTPQSGTEHAAQALAGGVLVNWQGAGHGALIQSPCATAAAQAFLIDGTVPRDGTVCPP